MTKQQALPIICAATLIFVGCSSPRTPYFSSQNSPSPMFTEKQWRKMADDREQEQYQNCKSDYIKGLTELSWHTGKAGSPVDKAYQRCLNEFRQDMNEESFHTFIIQQLPESSLWFDSAVWLQKNGLFSQMLSQKCEGQTNSAYRILYTPRTFYPGLARMLDVEPKVEVKAKFDSNGFFKEIVELKATSSMPFLERNAKEYVERIIICPSKDESTLSYTLRYAKSGTSISN